jgi:ADP-heptose:LPS heptosyltransferase
MSKNYDKTFVICKKGHETLYHDFAEVNNPPSSSKANMFTAPGFDVISAGAKIVGYSRKFNHHELTRWKFYDQDYVKYGMEVLGYKPDIIIHARNRRAIRKNDNYSEKNYASLIKMIRKEGLSLAVIGTAKNSSGLQGSIDSSYEDLRGMDLHDVTNLMYTAKCIVGTSSGPMHLATLCGCPQVVMTYNGNTKRYKEHWNPFKTPVEIVPGGWHPKPEAVFKSMMNILEKSDG